MQFIKTLFWVLLVLLLAVFSINNWNDVSITIWSDTLLDTKLPMLIIGSFILGFLPMWLLYRGSVWRNKRRIASLESRLTSQQSVVSTPASSDAEPASPLQSDPSS
ncbi:LapA family protein [Alterisphingorhabdus coralli]|uniref:LapA family protein n=1 Tax=Alterisphingorhabdus coralli TaxID=3071408 RepID=A0AA97F4F4_9SPHN|nr:LapA family protein [Parasphingorhabdus sp. SCSIO 66989]WOE73846.1 LapA family protein [Parasphingorhabdus sp. SCSIO 66989]